MKVETIVGESVYQLLLAATKNPEQQIGIFDDVVTYCNRDRSLEPLLKINVLLAMIKSAVRSHPIHQSQYSGNAETLIKSLGLDEASRIQLYEALFDKELIYKEGVVIYRG
jgi:hypothetical protein